MKPSMHYSVTPQAQRMRRERLTRENIRREIADWRNRTSNGEHYKAVDLIKLTGYLQCSDTERVELIDMVLEVLDETVG